MCMVAIVFAVATTAGAQSLADRIQAGDERLGVLRDVENRPRRLAGWRRQVLRVFERRLPVVAEPHLLRHDAELPLGLFELALADRDELVRRVGNHLRAQLAHKRFTPDRIGVRRIDLAHVKEFAARLPIAARMANLLEGGPLTIADIAIASPFVNFMHAGEKIDAAKYPNLAAFLDRMHNRPAFKELIAEEKALFGQAA